MTTRKLSTSSKDKDSDKCGSCGKLVSDNENAIQCEICDIWVHCKCRSISEEVYKVMKDMNNLNWYCDTCNASVGIMLKQITKMEARQEASEREIKTLTASVAANSSDIDTIKKDMNKINDKFGE